MTLRTLAEALAKILDAEAIGTILAETADTDTDYRVGEYEASHLDFLYDCLSALRPDAAAVASKKTAQLHGK